MTLKYLLDTNLLSEPINPNPNPAVLANLEQHQQEIATATTVWHELTYGCDRLPPSKKRQAIIRYLNEVIAPSLPILPYNHAAATWHGQERARLEALGQTAPFVDSQIAAIAKVNNLILVTRNLPDYERFDGILLENWFE